MSNGLVMEGIYHLGALSVAISGAYIGFDELGGRKEDFHADLRRAGDLVRTLLVQWGVDGGNKETLKQELNELDRRNFELLDYVTGQSSTSSGQQFLRYVRERERLFPCLWYFRNGRDLKTVGGLCITTTLLFIVFCEATKFWQTTFVEAHQINLVMIAYILFVATIVVVFVSVWASGRLQDLPERFEPFTERLRARITELLERQRGPDPQ